MLSSSVQNASFLNSYQTQFLSIFELYQAYQLSKKPKGVINFWTEASESSNKCFLAPGLLFRPQLLISGSKIALDC